MNIRYPIFVTDDGIVIVFNELQFKKHEIDSCFKLFGSLIDSNDVQLSNTLFPINVTFSGISIIFNNEQLKKHSSL